MIRSVKSKDMSSFITTYSYHNHCSYLESKSKFNTLIKSGLFALVLEDKSVDNFCWVENKIVNEKKIKYLYFLVNHWKVAESFINMCRWNINGEIWVELPKHHFLNRTLNKQNFKFIKVEDNKNIYNYTFIQRKFYGKLERTNNN